MPRQAKSPSSKVAHAEKVQILLERAQGGDTAALAELRGWAEGAGLWEQMGDLAWHAEEALLKAITGEDVLAREAIRCHLAQLGAELAGDGATPLERVLVARFVLCWGAANVADMAALAAAGGTPRQADHILRRQASAHRLLRGAARSLSLARKLLRGVPPPFHLTALVGEQEGQEADVPTDGGAPVENC